MEVHDRIRKLRKDYLKMSQSTFGERLGVNRDVINNIENSRLARPEQKLSLIKLMCREFSVREEWLINGTGPMFLESEAFSLDGFIKEHGASDLELEILRAYFELDVSFRLRLIEHFKSHLEKFEVPETPEDLEAKFPPVENSTQAG